MRNGLENGTVRRKKKKRKRHDPFFFFLISCAEHRSECVWHTVVTVFTPNASTLVMTRPPFIRLFFMLSTSCLNPINSRRVQCLHARTFVRRSATTTRALSNRASLFFFLSSLRFIYYYIDFYHYTKFPLLL